MIAHSIAHETADGRERTRLLSGAFAGVTFVDGVAIGIEDPGGMPNDPTFQGR